MNTNDVERRLEALAAASASPDLPPAILDKLARLESGAVDMTPIRLASRHRHRPTSPESLRRLMLIGLAAALTLTGGLAYALANQPKPIPSPTPPVALGEWHQVHTFTGSAYNQYETVSYLSWQNDEIVGLASGHDSFDLYQTCVLQSKNGIQWTCSELPKPTDLGCTTETCARGIGVAVKDGHWVATGLVSSAAGASGSATLVVWTSGDGVTWTEQPSARLSYYGAAPNVYLYEAAPIVLLATPYGFVRAGSAPGTLPQGSNILMTSRDGVAWEPAAMAPGSAPTTIAALSSDPTGGYLALGSCRMPDQTVRDCSAHSADGETWTTSYPTGSASSQLGSRLGLSSNPARVGGKWLVGLSTYRQDVVVNSTAVDDSGYYVATSADGLNWTVSPRPWPLLLQNTSSADGTEAFYPVYSEPGPSGSWAIAGGDEPWSTTLATYDPSAAPPTMPVESAHTYWSDDGIFWQRVANGPTGNPVAMVETPTQIVTILAAYPQGGGPFTYPASSAIVSVWVADKH